MKGAYRTLWFVFLYLYIPHKAPSRVGEGGEYPKLVTKSDTGREVHANSDITTKRNYI